MCRVACPRGRGLPPENEISAADETNADPAATGEPTTDVNIAAGIRAASEGTTPEGAQTELAVEEKTSEA
jgi:hypothetical protein